MVNIWSFLVQILGAHCVLCRAPADGICSDCLGDLPRNIHPCPRCAAPLPDATGEATLCAGCQKAPPAFERALAPLIYRAPVDGLVAAFKYRQRLPLGRTLAGVLGDALCDRGDLPQLLLPIPASATRLRERGFNQASELARCLAARLGVPWSTGRLVRAHDSAAQRGLTRRRRLTNLRGAFGCREGLLPAHVALIDDVMTTGATAEEASRILKLAGAERVEVWAVARTPLGDG